MDWKNTIRQRTLSDCGVACLKMIFNDCNIPVSLEALQEQLSLDYKGVNMYELKQAALKYGLKVSALRVKKSTLAKIEKTAIVHLNKKHFVVLDSVDVEGYVHLRDPIRGRCKITTDVFFKHSEGLVLAFQCKLIQ